MLNHGVQQIKESRKRNRDAIGILDFGFFIGKQSGDCKCHRDAVIATRIDLRAAQFRRPVDTQAVVELFDFDAHRAQVLHGRGDAIGFFQTQLCRVANLDAAFDLRTDNGQQRQLVD